MLFYFGLSGRGCTGKKRLRARQIFTFFILYNFKVYLYSGGVAKGRGGGLFARLGKSFSDLSANCFRSQRKYLSGSNIKSNIIVIAKILLNLQKLLKKLGNYDMS